MADFSKNEIIEDDGGGFKIIFDLDEDTIVTLELTLGVNRDSPDFSQHFENFVNAGISSYLSSYGGLND
jgi:hypothetical protein